MDRNTLNTIASAAKIVDGASILSRCLTKEIRITEILYLPNSIGRPTVASVVIGPDHPDFDAMKALVRNAAASSSTEAAQIISGAGISYNGPDPATLAKIEQESAKEAQSKAK